MEPNSSFARSLLERGLIPTLESCTSGRIILLAAPKPELENRFARNPLVHLPIRGYEIGARSITFDVMSGEVSQSGIAAWARVYLDPVGWLDCTVGYSGCELNLANLALSYSNTLHISQFNLTTPGFDEYPIGARVFRILDALGLAVMSEEDGLSRVAAEVWERTRRVWAEITKPKVLPPAPGSIDIFW
jgi:hypothetical protein